MAEKATTRKSIENNMLGETSEPPKVERATVEEMSTPDILAKVEQPKTVKVTSPLGSVTEVPESLVDSLLESGYSKSK